MTKWIVALLLLASASISFAQQTGTGGAGAGNTGGGALPIGTKGQSVYYAANGTAGTAITNALIVPPSGDATGATDGVNISAACTSTGAVQLISGAYHVGASNAVITLAAPCKITGQGTSTVVTNHGTTNDIFRISYYTDWSEGPWIYPASTNQTEIAEMQFAQSGTPTAGFIFDVGSGIAAGGGIFHYTMNVHIHDTVANGLWGGLKLIPDELYAFVDHNMWRQFVGGGAVLYSACLGSGDNHISDNEFSGLANSGIIITCSDTTMFAHDKLNGSGIKFTGAAATKSVQFTDMSVETGDFSQACAYDFGTGSAPVNTQILGGEQYGFNTLFCHPSNAAGLSFNLANTLITTDYAAGLITNNGYATVTFPPVITYQDFASFAGTAATLLSAYTTASPGSGKTFTLYSAAAGTTIPQLNGSSAAYLPSGTDSTFGDSLDTLTPASANYTVGITCTKVAGSPTVGIFARAASGANTNYIVQYPTSASAFQLYSQVAGTFVLLGSSNLTWTNGTSHTMVLTVNGTTISATIDGATTIGPFTNSAVTAVGQAGLRLTGGGNATCTNFYVQ